MKISRRSWHFRLYIGLISLWSEGTDFFEGARSTHRPKNLCRYFWTIMVMLISIPIWSVLALAFSFIVGIILVGEWIYRTDTWGKWRRRRRRRDTKCARRLRFEDKERAEKEPSLLVSYIKARKQKACPLIEVVE